MTQPLPASSTPSAQATARPFPIPVNYFAMALGTGALGAAWRAAASAGMTPAWVGEAILAFTAEQLEENFQAALEEVNRLKPSSAKGRYISKATVATTFGPGIPVDPAAVAA